MFGVKPGTACRAYVFGQHPKNTAGRDITRRIESRFAPELVQAAKALGLHPAELEKRLRVARGIARLTA